MAVSGQVNPDGTCTLVDPRAVLYSELPPEQQAYEVAQLRPQNATALMQPDVSYEGWRDVPCSYLMCENDQAIWPGAQQRMVALAKSKGGDIHVETCSTGHFPFVSHPEVVVKLIQRAAAGAAE